MSKEVELKALYDEYIREVTQNPTCKNAGGYSFVLGDGSADSKVVLIGEAPGKDEVAEGRPFVGKAGSILDSFMDGAGIVRSELFITNSIKYRLARESKSGKGLANRPAKTKEIAQSAVFLAKELQIINPKIIVTLGNVPLKSISLCAESFNVSGSIDELLLSLKKGVGTCHGRSFEIFFGDGKNPGEKSSLLFPLYHPASIIYNSSLKAVYEKDLAALRKLIL